MKGYSTDGIKKKEVVTMVMKKIRFTEQQDTDSEKASTLPERMILAKMEV